MRMGRRSGPLFELRFITILLPTAGFGFRFAPQRLARRRRPVLSLLVALGIAVIGPLEIAEGDDEAGPAVNKSALENVMLEERPKSVSERARHGDAFIGELLHSQRRIAVGLAQDFFKVAEGELPDRIRKRADRLAAWNFKTLVNRLCRVTHAA